MTNLSVNINKIATLRNARGGDTPNVIQFALDCEQFGANGITIHPRPDERHITRADAVKLSQVILTELNIEGYPDERFMDLVAECKPKQATLVPDPPHVLTSNAGWDLEENSAFLTPIISRLKKMKIRVSLFVGTDLKQIGLAASLGADCIELYTGPYAEANLDDREKIMEAYTKAANLGISLGLAINAGHDLNSENLAFFKSKIPSLAEVSIGHALIADALYLGIEKTIRVYKSALKD